MSFPNYPDKYQSDSIMQPEHTLDVRRKYGRFPNIAPPESLILCFKNGLPKQMRWQIPVQQVGRVLGDFYLIRRAHGRVAVLSEFGIGAPLVVSLVEEMIVFGIKKFVILSWGGALQPDLNLGDIVLCDCAIRDEGVSHHYLPSQKYITADIDLTKQIGEAFKAQSLAYKTGTTWTTDAPYRETVDEVNQYQAEDVQTVEMESAALFALGEARKVQTASVVIASDSLANLKWQAPSEMKSIDQSFRSAYSAVIRALS